MAIIQLTNVTKTFGKFKALDQVNLEVNQGEIYGFIGPNGAGKSTSIRVMLGILQATSGTAQIFGKDAWKDAVEIHKHLTYVPGDVNLWPNLTGGEAIDLFLNLSGKSKNKTKKNELLERFNLDPSKKCRTYSKGNRQKVALVAAFASDADLFIFDEPTSGLDPLMESVFHSLVKEEQQAGKTILLSSHILSEVEKLCDKISIIRQGKIIETGTLDEMRHLTRTNITVQTEQPLKGIEHLAGIHNFQIQQDSDTVHFQLDPQETPNVLDFLNTHKILRLESTPATLEDLFMDYYKDR